ncbi:MAG: PSD1 and planctomycete cytochrome C domain-containing protein [Pirellulaceae bacterium]|nr:PSD1 and planctomycete cytochrome C domain-containing protein [Pirellulaceae bacterium]
MNRTCVFFLLIHCGSANFIAADESIQFFEKSVRPLLVKRCYQCHSGDKAGGGLSLETRSSWQTGGESGSPIVPGRPEASLLIDAINYEGLEMPPADAGGKLTDDEITILTKWIRIGAPDPRTGRELAGRMSVSQAHQWWAFRPLQTGGTQDTSIDELITQKIQNMGIAPSPAADKRSLIRRATYNLTGLPPSPAQVDNFLADDSPDAFDKVIDRLLNSPQYGVHWGRHWLDVVRYADTAGENTDRPLPHAWKYRNWVFDSFNQNLPFDKFARYQICGDLLAADSSHHANNIIATGYLAIARRFGHDIDKDIHLMHEDVIDNLGKNFLALTLGCARCHDHKYDAISSTDYYALYGVFASTRFSFPGCEPQGKPRDLVPLTTSIETKQLQKEHEEKLAAWKSAHTISSQQSQRLKELASVAVSILGKGKVAEGATVSLHQNQQGRMDRVPLNKDEVLQLTILPNGNHGADTTRIKLEIADLDSGKRWNAEDLIPRFSQSGGPIIEDRDAAWCFLDVQEGPQFLTEKKENLQGKVGLNGWALNGTPSFVVNASSKAYDVWTRIPPGVLNMHPGPQRNVGLAWICPDDGVYSIQGSVTDGHPAGLDGVSFQFERFASAELGQLLRKTGDFHCQAHPPQPSPPIIPVAYAVTDGTPTNARLHRRGDPEQPGEEVPRRWLESFGGRSLAEENASGREPMADLIVASPLFARVIANRIWGWHFGQGIVATPNDFGTRGAKPTHPQLLDWLANQIVAHDFKLKSIHRLIMKSKTYQRATETTSSQLAADPENRFLSRFERRRLSAEEIRDTLLFFSGDLQQGFAGKHPFPAEGTWTFTQHNPFNAIYDTKHRSAFMMVQRQRRHPYLALFDGADPNSSTPQREATTVPTQALYFLNAPFFHQQSARFASTNSPSSGEDHDFIVATFRKLYQRKPTTEELKIGASFLQNYLGETAETRSAYCRVLMAANEFIYLD